jgi:drug/metabolite transporter (DMT)-like permease
MRFFRMKNQEIMKQIITYLKIIFTVSAWGGSFVATKIALDDVSPVTVVWLRFTIGILLMGGMVYLRKQIRIPHRNDLAYFALLGFIGITFHQWLQSNGLITAKATTTAWIVATTPIFIAILGWMVLKEKMKWNAILGTILATLGVIVVVTQGDFSSMLEGQFGTPGDFLILISAPNWAIFSILSRKGLHEHPPGLMTLYVMLFGWLGTTVFFLSGTGLQEISTLSQNGWRSVIFLGVVATGLSYAFWYDGLEKIPASRVGVFLYLEPLVTILMANFLLNEPLLITTSIGGVIILIGVGMVNHSKFQI